MPITEEKLRTQIRELETLRDRAKAAVENVRQLLAKADERRVEEGYRPWNRILDNLERALVLTRSQVTSYEQQIKERQRTLQDLLRRDPTSAVFLEESLAAVGLQGYLPEDFHLPEGHVEIAEQLLAVPLDMLGNMTLDEVENMNEQMFIPKVVQEPSAQEPVEAAKKSQLDERIEHARQAREAIATSVHRSEPSFAERRRQRVLRSAVAKIMIRDFKGLDMEEVERLLECHSALAERPAKAANDARLLELLAHAMDLIQERASDLRRKRAQQYTRKKL
jgi:hypothetical protein